MIERFGASETQEQYEVRQRVTDALKATTEALPEQATAFDMVMPLLGNPSDEFAEWLLKQIRKLCVPSERNEAIELAYALGVALGVQLQKQ